jgi:hypothetical protein
MPLELVATAGTARGASMVVVVPPVGSVVQFRLEGLDGRRVVEFSVGTNPSSASLGLLNDFEIDQRFGVAGLTKEGHPYDAVSYEIRMTPGMVHHAAVSVLGERDGEPVEEYRTVLVLAAAEPTFDPGVIDLSVGGTGLTVFIPLPGPPGMWMAAGLTVKSPNGTSLATVASVIDSTDQSARCASFGPPLRPGHDYLIDVVLVDPSGAAVQIVRGRPARLKRRVVTVSLSDVMVLDDLDWDTAGDFRLYARILGRLRDPIKDVEHVLVGSTHEFKLDSEDQLENKPDRHPLPIFPDSQDFTLVDGPVAVEDDRFELWVSVVASERDDFGTERAYGLMRLYVPNTSAVEQSTLEEWIDQPLAAWDQDDPAPVLPPKPGPGVLELWTEPLEDPRVHALSVFGTYSIRYVN